MTESIDDEGDYFIPLTDQRVFGAGVKKKGIAFVPASSEEFSDSAPPKSTSTSAGDRYLSIVLGKNASLSTTPATQDPGTQSNGTSPEHVICPMCKQPVSVEEDMPNTGSHETSIAHQVCLQHSYPPSHLNRDHVGVRYLSGYGWNPDGREGLGARAEGIRIPIKAKEKRDTAGLGSGTTKDNETDKSKAKSSVKREDKIVKLNLKELRKMELEKQKRGERLRQAFYSEDLSQYLGPGG